MDDANARLAEHEPADLVARPKPDDTRRFTTASRAPGQWLRSTRRARSGATLGGRRTGRGAQRSYGAARFSLLVMRVRLGAAAVRRAPLGSQTWRARSASLHAATQLSVISNRLLLLPRPRRGDARRASTERGRSWAVARSHSQLLPVAAKVLCSSGRRAARPRPRFFVARFAGRRARSVHLARAAEGSRALRRKAWWKGRDYYPWADFVHTLRATARRLRASVLRRASARMLARLGETILCVLSCHAARSTCRCASSTRRGHAVRVLREIESLRALRRLSVVARAPALLKQNSAHGVCRVGRL